MINLKMAKRQLEWKIHAVEEKEKEKEKLNFTFSSKNLTKKVFEISETFNFLSAGKYAAIELLEEYLERQLIVLLKKLNVPPNFSENLTYVIETVVNRMLEAFMKDLLFFILSSLTLTDKLSTTQRSSTVDYVNRKMIMNGVAIDNLCEEVKKFEQYIIQSFQYNILIYSIYSVAKDLMILLMKKFDLYNVKTHKILLVQTCSEMEEMELNKNQLLQTLIGRLHSITQYWYMYGRYEKKEDSNEMTLETYRMKSETISNSYIITTDIPPNHLLVDVAIRSRQKISISISICLLVFFLEIPQIYNEVSNYLSKLLPLDMKQLTTISQILLKRYLEFINNS
ncbi:hypothetical protein SNEBB_005549 [Seison nebaliae]|nr:hypothetical protein SNEBB_005549 [Seison nebaliae]